MGPALTAAAPLIPDGDEAREWAERELADPAYTIAEPTPLDRFAHEVAQFFLDLFNADLPDGWGPWMAVLVTVLIVAVVVVALVVWGMPRTSARSRAATELFGEREQRTAAQLRTAAEQLAARQEWDAAVAERFRALARGLGERAIVDGAPGATVHAFARDAAAAFPALADDLERAAAAFDDVRYLRRPGTAELYRTVASVDDAVITTAPHRPDLVVATP
ncbi:MULTISPECIES: DUF4129 domain-containing protein [unclassified Microbacterium]|uniref:DUF4129 domain-containing protein n=1 Tax=unclassified Microbacterium TaxID=2609290 RepID=UPI00214B144E|nr:MULTISPECIES: DUF4129 domain-containing protein [unclassified Microbacterium]MCR2785246.1 DUF4129 domain-containing protein [Microbacterium sp. zg.B96]MDL5352608.1 DUF4129 domain-containing protein [Microbacterium sp. zg-YB36]WIM16776.1 DUF4129 domain-containing protein [Microbacterium sp. zg-B96]